MKTVSREQDQTSIDEARTGELGLPPSVQAALGELVNAAKDGLLALSVGVGLGVLHELMEVEVVRHEALSYRAGCETPPTGCRSSPGKLGAAGAWNRGRGWQAALTTTGRAGTIGRDGAGLASKAERRSESEPVVESPQDSTQLKPGGYGLATRCAATREFRGSLALGGNNFVPPGVRDGCCVTVATGTAGEKLDAGPADRTTVNVGTDPDRPWWGKARCLLMIQGRGGAFVVVGAGESPVHGEGRQRACSARLGCEEVVVE
jgi:hypothetical protein